MRLVLSHESVLVRWLNEIIIRQDVVNNMAKAEVNLDLDDSYIESLELVVGGRAKCEDEDRFGMASDEYACVRVWNVDHPEQTVK